jgi:hypothetical protein
MLCGLVYAGGAAKPMMRAARTSPAQQIILQIILTQKI